MKKLIILFFFLSGMRAFGQEELIKKITLQVDSLLEKIKVEKDEDKRVALFLDIVNTGVEAYPNLILEAYRKLYRISQENRDILDEACAWSFAGQGYRLSGNFIKALECHHKAVALIIFMIGLLVELPGDPHVRVSIINIGIVLFGHSSMDRFFGYGLKYENGFKFTHLGEIGKRKGVEVKSKAKQEETIIE